MQIIQTHISGCFKVIPQIFGDSRGYFFESFNQEKWQKLTGIITPFIQDNEAYSTYGVIRGLHRQVGEYAQAKLVRAVKGKVLDVAVDMREGSATYGQHVAVELSEENKEQLYVPRGFLHGYAVLSETAVFAYKCDNVYQPSAESAVHYNDPKLNINWNIPEAVQIISEKDRLLPFIN